MISNEDTKRTTASGKACRIPTTQTCGTCERPFTVYRWIEGTGCKNYRFGRCAECAAWMWEQERRR